MTVYHHNNILNLICLVEFRWTKTVINSSESVVVDKIILKNDLLLYKKTATSH